MEREEHIQERIDRRPHPPADEAAGRRPNKLSLRPRLQPVSRRTHPLAWIIAAFCTVFSIIIILSGLAVLTIYLVFRPKSPRFDIASVSLNAAYLDAGALLNADVTILTNFSNPNRKVDVSFGYLQLDLYFHGVMIATQGIGPFAARRGESTLRNVHMISSQVALPPKAAKAWTDGVAANRVAVKVVGSFRTRANLGRVLHLTYWLHSNCNIMVSAPPNGVLQFRRYVQYADIPDGLSYSGVPRYYRHSILVLQRAVSKWNDHKVQFAMNFGDIVDGFCPKDKSLSTVQKVIKEFNGFNGPTYHMIGNHCLYNLPRNELISLFKMPSFDGHAYYDFSPSPGYRFVILDAYDISAIGWPKDHAITLTAMQILEKKNPNANKNSPNGMVGLEKRFLMFNGAVGKEQLLWLDSILRDSSKNKEKVIICCHLPIHPKAASMKALVWNYEEVLKVIHSYKCVKACFAGHDHQGGYFVDTHGIHHRVFEAALESPPGSNSFGHIDVYHDRFSLIGTDRMKSTEMVFS
ncbi:hypothetical protein Cni_G05302 [Canna indica]|uniref:Manganese-dependent ADP-ribose/CDP-alcohol diphosphatase n=1 Tax=Canna indica TaxID=4628 RepID=A0AAQ3Q4U2_9LILI|nr:hypothetical protein Cni_G05302 [Canna indica]